MRAAIRIAGTVAALVALSAVGAVLAVCEVRT